MATALSSIRFIGSSSSCGASVDALSRFLADLCTRGTPKESSELALKKYVEEEARDLSGEAFSRFMDQLYDHVSCLLESNDVADNMGALRAVDALIDLTLGESAPKVSKFSGYMRTIFDAKRDREVLVLASTVLGHLARAGRAMTADEVERHIKNSLDWLRGDRIEYRRFASVLILKEMATNASTVFNVFVSEFVDAIWVALRDPTLTIRERAVEALRACLGVIEERETRWRVLWYYQMCEAALVGLGKNAPVHSIHGSLLAVGELLRNTGEFMMSRYREVADIVLKYLQHRDRLVRLSITSLLPRIAYFLRDRFVTNYLQICMDHILAVLRIPNERSSGFIALAEMAGALNDELIPYLPAITVHLREAIASWKGRPSPEALACVGSFAKAMGPEMEPHARDLLDSMISGGLSPVLVDVLEQITLSILSLLPIIQERLLDCISIALSRSPKPTVSSAHTNIMNNAQQLSDISGSVPVQLALRMLGQFNFKGHELLLFTRESVVIYLEDEDGNTRREAAVCSCRLVANSFGDPPSDYSRSRSNRIGGTKKRLLIEEVPFRLTRMLVKAMEVSGIEGNFRSTCENVMQVLQTNKDSVMAMMEACVHDPLINWRLLNFNEVPQTPNYGSSRVLPVVNGEECAPTRDLPQPLRGIREKELLQAVNQLGDAKEVLNELAVVVMARMSNKLTGKDFSSISSVSGAASSIQYTDQNALISGDREVDHGLSVKHQVQKLILQATSHENLCQNYVGWCPFW